MDGWRQTADVAASRSDNSSSSPFPCPPFNLKCVTWHNTRQIPLPLWGVSTPMRSMISFFPSYGDSWKTGPVTPRVTRCWLHWAPLSFHLNAFAVFVPQNSFSIIHQVIRWFLQDSSQLTAFKKICYSVHFSVVCWDRIIFGSSVGLFCILQAYDNTNILVF